MDILKWAALSAVLISLCFPPFADWLGESLAAVIALVRPFF